MGLGLVLLLIDFWNMFGFFSSGSKFDPIFLEGLITDPVNLKSGPATLVFANGYHGWLIIWFLN